jgi:parallel beta-helix repeat protein
MRSRSVRALLSLIVTFAAMLVVPLQAEGTTGVAVLQVPQDFPTIQAAVNAAAAGDTILVSPGTYVELVDFLGKPITVESTDGPATTVIDGNHAGTVVRISAGPAQTPTLRGFTVRNGVGQFSGGGIITTGGPALIEGNRVTGNSNCNGAIEVFFSDATVRNNVISGNAPNNCGGGLGGGGILIGGAGAATITGNVITDNVSSSDGGGIAMWAAGAPTISGNVISGNTANIGGVGGGISHFNASNSLITNNLIVGNTAGQGGGIHWLVPSGQPGPTAVNNTIADNSGAAVLADGYDVSARLVNNILVASGSAATLHCGDLNDPNPPVIEHNDVFNTGSGPRYGGICTDQTGLNGNISADPLFVDPATGDYHLTPDSPAVDSGQAAGAPATDIDGDARPLDGNGDGTPVVDMGADEVREPDTVSPTITCAATPATLTPANRRMRPVHVDISASDDSGTVTITLISVTSSQPDSGLGGGDLPGDIQEWTTGIDDRDGQLRAERFGPTRVYTLTYRAADPAGNTATCHTTVTVP